MYEKRVGNAYSLSLMVIGPCSGATPCDSVLVHGLDGLHLLNDDPGAGIAGLGGCGSLLGVLQLQQVCARGRCAIGRGMHVGKHRLVATEFDQSYHCTRHIHLQQDTHISGHTSLKPLRQVAAFLMHVHLEYVIGFGKLVGQDQALLSLLVCAVE